MKMNNRGFTLVELLAVMVILISISLIVVGSISSSLLRREVKECEQQQELAVGAAKIYFSLSEVNVTSVTVETLVSGSYLDSKYLVNNGGRLDTNDVISLGSSDYKYNGNVVGTSCD